MPIDDADVGVEVTEHLAGHKEAELRPLPDQPNYPALVLRLCKKIK